MTKKLYYQDSYVIIFEANIVEHIRTDDDRLAVVLDQTHFYPTSGGQPCDKGLINGVEVVDVTIRESDGAVVHLLADEVWDDHVRGEIDWPRRFDHMQRHSGQHILSAAFYAVAQAETVGFHLGADSCTIDLDVKELSPDQVDQVETVANQVIFKDRRIRSTIVPAHQVDKLSLRTAPPPTGPVRVVEVEKFDLTACGGTHVGRSGEIGMIKVLKLVNRRKGLRVEFVCGGRALIDYRAKNKLVYQLAAEFSVGYWDLDTAVLRMRDEVKLLRSQMRQANERLLQYEARDLLMGARFHKDLRVVSAVFEGREQSEVNWLCRALISQTGVVVLFGLAGPRSQLLFARAEDVNPDMRVLLKAALRVLGSTAGGGRPEMAQGGGPEADLKRVEQAIDRAERLLLAQRGG